MTAKSIGLVLALAGCASQNITGESTAGITNNAGFEASTKIVGTLEYGQTGQIAYQNPPMHSAFKFYGRTGDKVVLDVTSSNDAIAWITDSAFNTLATNDDASAGDKNSHITLTLPVNATADQHTYYAVVREKNEKATTFSVSLAAPAHDTADWRGRSIYFVVTDRFANGDATNDNANGFSSNKADPNAWHGGDFKGLTDHLDYIAGMGFTGLWITPVVKQNSVNGYHGYWAWDFSQIDAHLGDMADLTALVSAAHARGIAVMIDTVANHTGRYSYEAATFPDASMYHHNGSITNWSDPNQLVNFDVNGLNDLDQTNATVHQALLDHVRWLVATTGADALRVDTVKHVPITFWKEHSAAAGVFTIGEVYDTDVPSVAPFSHALDAALDYPLYYVIKNVIANGQSATQLSTLFAQDSAYSDPLLNGVFADNHDQPRFKCTIPSSVSAAEQGQDMRLALALTFTTRGLPILYYGTEQGLTSCTDSREDMVSFDDNSSLYKYVAQLNAARNDALRIGQQIERWQDATAYAFERESGKSAALVTFNFGTTERTITMKHMHAPAGTVLKDALGGSESATIASDLTVSVTVPARSVSILTAN